MASITQDQPKGRRLVPLPEAAFRLEIRYDQAYKLLLSGALKGRRQKGRWFVYTSELPPLEFDELSVDERR